VALRDDYTPSPPGPPTKRGRQHNQPEDSLLTNLLIRLLACLLTRLLSLLMTRLLTRLLSRQMTCLMT
jgi:hypothetical protein